MFTAAFTVLGSLEAVVEFASLAFIVVFGMYSENGGGYLFSSRTFENEYLLFDVRASLFMGYCATTVYWRSSIENR